MSKQYCCECGNQTLLGYCTVCDSSDIKTFIAECNGDEDVCVRCPYPYPCPFDWS